MSVTDTWRGMRGPGRPPGARAEKSKRHRPWEDPLLPELAAIGDPLGPLTKADSARCRDTVVGLVVLAGLAHDSENTSLAKYRYMMAPLWKALTTLYKEGAHVLAVTGAEDDATIDALADRMIETHTALDRRSYNTASIQLPKPARAVALFGAKPLTIDRIRVGCVQTAGAVTYEWAHIRAVFVLVLVQQLVAILVDRLPWVDASRFVGLLSTLARRDTTAPLLDEAGRRLDKIQATAGVPASLAAFAAIISKISGTPTASQLMVVAVTSPGDLYTLMVGALLGSSGTMFLWVDDTAAAAANEYEWYDAHDAFIIAIARMASILPEKLLVEMNVGPLRVVNQGSVKVQCYKMAGAGSTPVLVGTLLLVYAERRVAVAYEDDDNITIKARYAAYTDIAGSTIVMSALCVPFDINDPVRTVLHAAALPMPSSVEELLQWRTVGQLTTCHLLTTPGATSFFAKGAELCTTARINGGRLTPPPVDTDRPFHL